MRTTAAIDDGGSGAKASSYSRDDVVISQYSECIKMSPSVLFERLQQIGGKQEKIREETLVMLARAFRRSGKETPAWKTMLLICERVRPSVLRAAKLWRLTPVVAEEFIESTLSTLYDVILNDIDDEPFWEIKFWVCFERRLLTALRKYRTYSDRYVEADAVDTGNSIRGNLDQNGSYNSTDPAFRVVVAEGLSQLPEHIRTAFMLKHWAGFPECSLDPNDRATIAQVMRISDRTVRNYLARAELLLNAWRHGDGTSVEEEAD
jgi:hypothetical protein